MALIDLNKYEVTFPDQDGVMTTRVMWAMPTGLDEWLETNSLTDTAVITMLAEGIKKGEQIEEGWWLRE